MGGLAPVAAASRELRDALQAAGLPTEDLEEPGRMFFRFVAEGRTTGYGGLEFHGADALLRSVVVLPDFRGQGHGRRLTEALLARAAELEAHRAYLLTTDAEAFFTHLGFAPVPRSAAPAAILATRQATSICASAALLGKALTSHG